METWRLLCGQANWPLSVGALIFDIDKTLYDNTDYHASGTRGEVAEIARILGRGHEEAESAIATQRSILSLELGRPATMTATVLSLGVTRRQWNELRCRAWKPEEWLKDDPDICMMFLTLQERYRVDFATNSPREVGVRVLKALGVDVVMPNVLVFGPESFDVSKPDPAFFANIAKQLGFTSSQCLSVGDREEADGIPAIAAGYAGALIVESRDVLVEIVPQLFLGYKTEVSHGS